MFKVIGFLLILSSIKLMQSIKVNDFCYQISIKYKVIDCEENNKYNYDCGHGLCAIDRYSCQSLKLFSSVKNIEKNEAKKSYIKNNFKLFMSLIKDCKKSLKKYKLNLIDVCLKRKDCFKEHGFGIWSILMKPDKCKCKGKYNYKCNSDYCASDKRACDYLRRPKKVFAIKSC
jgi:hypothetical protein